MEERLGYRFVDSAGLRHALTHRSWCAEHSDEPSNERLEFLGDAILGMIVTDHLFERFPDRPEGQLAKIRASVVSAASLAEVGTRLGMGEALRLGRGEDSSGGRHKPSIVADAVEAVLGAIYLDGGMGPARALVLELLKERIAEAALRPGEADYKTRLQEFAVRDGHQLPEYTITESGPDHHKRFGAVVRVGGRDVGTGDGNSKKEAEQSAARAACNIRLAGDGDS